MPGKVHLGGGDRDKAVIGQGIEERSFFIIEAGKVRDREDMTGGKMERDKANLFMSKGSISSFTMPQSG